MGDIRFMNNKARKEVEKLIKEDNLHCSVEEFRHKHNFHYLERYKIYSEDFLREFKDKVNWYWIFFCRTYSKDFVMEFKDKFMDGDYNENYRITKKMIEEIEYIPIKSRFEILDL